MTQRYALIGAGGTGSALIDPLVRYLTTHHGGTDPDVWQLGVIDGDAVEPKNLERQLFSEGAIGVNKARALATTFGLPGVIGIPEYLDRTNIARYLTEGVTVLIAVDNFPVRALIEDHVATLRDAIVVNGGNERHTGSCQVWVRQNGEDVTPRLSFLHPELRAGGDDRAAMTCTQVAALQGGEQLIVANMASAMWMLTGLMQIQRNTATWTEVQFDVTTGDTVGLDQRQRKGWQKAAA